MLLELARPMKPLQRLVSTGLQELDRLLSDGYPEKSAILVVGPAGIGKEALRYSFLRSGLQQGDLCLYLTKSTPTEVVHDMKGLGFELSRLPTWFSREGGELRYDVNDLASMSHNIKEVLRNSAGARVRIVMDVLSSLLVLNEMEVIYRFMSQLLSDVKQYDVVLVATMEEGMHDLKVVSTMTELFDGVIEFKLYEEGLRVTPLFRVKKMRGIPPQSGYYNFSLSRGKMEVSAYAR